jgi:hypothetical protein
MDRDSENKQEEEQEEEDGEKRDEVEYENQDDGKEPRMIVQGGIVKHWLKMYISSQTISQLSNLRKAMR